MLIKGERGAARRRNIGVNVAVEWEDKDIFIREKYTDAEFKNKSTMKKKKKTRTNKQNGKIKS